MKRALKFLLVFVIVVTAVLLITTFPFFSAFKTLLSNSKGMAEGSEYIERTYSLKSLAEFIGEHPEFVSLVSYNVDNPDSSIYYQADVPRTLGVLSNIFLLAEYERQVEAGILNPQDKINIDDITRFTLPDVSTGSHKEALSILRKIDSKQISLDHAVATMVQVGDLAISDYLWFLLGQENIEALMDSLELEHTDLPLPFSGLYISINPNLSDTSKTFTNEEVIALATRFKNDDDFNKNVTSTFDDNRIGISFMQERDALAKFPQTTAREMAQVMFKLQKDEFISETVSANIKQKMRWVFGGETIPLTFDDYGAIYDTRMGMLSGIDVGTSIFTGSTSAQAMFFDRLPVAFWMHLSANHMQEDFQQRIIWDPALLEVTLLEISKSE
ncbi:MAG: serine hydrolase [Balneolaceae bacterium]